MRKLRLVRVSQGVTGVFGVIVFESPRYVTIEPPWRDNRAGESCIPSGEYLCRRVHSPKFGETFELQDVPGRSEILFHAGNLVSDTRGCILLGMQFDRHTPAILWSRQAVTGFMIDMRDEAEFILLIEPCLLGE